jgi:hypothetical protein
MSSENLPPIAPSNQEQPGSGLLVRLGWMVVATVTMLITGFVILSTPAWSMGPTDAVFWGAALFAIVLRYVDIKRYGGETSRGEPATMGHFARYALGLTGIGLAFWTIAQSAHI